MNALHAPPHPSGRPPAYGAPAALLALFALLTIGASLASAHPGHVHFSPTGDSSGEVPADRAWLAGDHHVHSEFSVGYDRTVSPPKPIIAGDAIFPIATNARMARRYGLAWMVATDHGGPHHAKLNLEQAYPSFLESRRDVPEVIQFWGMEFDTPAADHSSIILPHTEDEAARLHELESRFSKREAFPLDPDRDTEEKMLEALRHMRTLAQPPIVIAHHPSRSARAPDVYGLTQPSELRGWNDAAPNVAVGMEGSPGHQAAALEPDLSLSEDRRGGYRNFPTMGGFDQMTARLGGFWDSMLGEGRRWWITATSDSHKNWREGGSDFWPGEYSKTYVHAAKTHHDILDGLRHGRVFVTTGDLISELYVSVAAQGGSEHAAIGGTLKVPGDTKLVEVAIRFRPPSMPNARGQIPQVTRVDLIVGSITGPVADRNATSNPTTRIEHRFAPRYWKLEDGYLTMRHTMMAPDGDFYVRVRGTNTDELEPSIDPAGEDPWSDLWFYSNPIFVERTR